MKRAGALLCAFLLSACSSDDQAGGFAELGITVENEIGARSRITCEALPFLHGSRRLTEHVIDGAFTITVWSSPSEARLTFEEGARPLAQKLVIPRSALEGDYSSELVLTLGSGQRYFVDLASGCSP